MQCDICGKDMICVGIDRDGETVSQKFACINKACPTGAKNREKYTARQKNEEGEKDDGKH